MRKSTETLVRQLAAQVGGLESLRDAAFYLMLRDEWREEKAEDPELKGQTFNDFIGTCIDVNTDSTNDAREFVVDCFTDAAMWHGATGVLIKR